MSKLFLLLILATFSLIAYSQSSSKIFTSDIDNFWIAYDSVQSTNDSAKQIQFIQTLYMDKATEGLKDFIISRQHSAARHLKNIKKYPGFWVSLRPHTQEIKLYIGDITKVMTRFKKLYPEFKEPAVYFTIGCLNSGGTTSPDKILIGSEIAASDSTVDASELGEWLQGVFKQNTNVVSMVAHEAGHTQQKGGDAEDDGNSNLLGYCIREGACDFIAELLLQKPLLTPYIIYGKENENKLWVAFKKEMNGQDIRNWLYNGSDAPDGHADLGYFMGYTICKS
ncbi:MAG: DUF2268 domain-containing putative Zn-dependent protease, partial [Flavobacterium sp.]